MATTTTPRRWPRGRCSKGRSGELGMWRPDPSRVRPCCPLQEEGMGRSLGLDLSRLPSPSTSDQALQEMECLVGRACLKLSIESRRLCNLGPKEELGAIGHRLVGVIPGSSLSSIPALLSAINFQAEQLCPGPGAAAAGWAGGGHGAPGEPVPRGALRPHTRPRVPHR